MGQAGKEQKGSVLILALWALALLTVFVVQIGIGVRQKIDTLSRLEKHQSLRLAATSAAQAGIAVGRRYFSRMDTEFTAESKSAVINSPLIFRRMTFPRAEAEVSRTLPGKLERQYGIIDEESKIGINSADMSTLMRLFEGVLGLQEHEAQTLAEAVIEWREKEEDAPEDVDNSAYYERLEYPYPIKHAAFERIEELMLIKDMDIRKYKLLKDFVSVYSGNTVDINTAPSQVFDALGLSSGLRDKIMATRKGLDRVEGTADDFVFDHSNDKGIGLPRLMGLEPDEIVEMHQFFMSGKLGVVPGHLYVRSAARATISDGSETQTAQIKVIESVFRIKDGKIIYWRED